MNPPAVCVFPSTGAKRMVPSSIGWPSTLTVPLTSAIDPSPQPASPNRTTRKRAAKTKRADCIPISRESSKVAHDFAAVHRAERLPGCQVNGVGNKTDRSVAQCDIDPAGMPAAGGAVLTPSRGHGHERVIVGDGPVDHIGGTAVGSGDCHELEDAVIVLDVAPPIVILMAPGPEGFRHQQRVGSSVGDISDLGDSWGRAVAFEVCERSGWVCRLWGGIVLDRSPIDDIVTTPAIIAPLSRGHLVLVRPERVAGAVVEWHIDA